MASRGRVPNSRGGGPTTDINIFGAAANLSIEEKRLLLQQLTEQLSNEQDVQPTPSTATASSSSPTPSSASTSALLASCSPLPIVPPSSVPGVEPTPSPNTLRDYSPLPSPSPSFGTLTPVTVGAFGTAPSPTPSPPPPSLSSIISSTSKAAAIALLSPTRRDSGNGTVMAAGLAPAQLRGSAAAVTHVNGLNSSPSLAAAITSSSPPSLMTSGHHLPSTLFTRASSMQPSLGRYNSSPPVIARSNSMESSDGEESVRRPNEDDDEASFDENAEAPIDEAARHSTLKQFLLDAAAAATPLTLSPQREESTNSHHHHSSTTASDSTVRHHPSGLTMNHLMVGSDSESGSGHHQQHQHHQPHPNELDHSSTIPAAAAALASTSQPRRHSASMPLPEEPKEEPQQLQQQQQQHQSRHSHVPAPSRSSHHQSSQSSIPTATSHQLRSPPPKSASPSLPHSYQDHILHRSPKKESPTHRTSITLPHPHTSYATSTSVRSPKVASMVNELHHQHHLSSPTKKEPSSHPSHHSPLSPTSLHRNHGPSHAHAQLTRSQSVSLSRGVTSPSPSPSPVSPSASAASTTSPTPLSPSANGFRHRIFENFLVLGCSPTPELLSQHLSSWTEPPKILLKFPHHSTIEAQDVAEFAFPSDVKLVRVDVTQSATGLNSLLYGQKQFQRGENCHVFSIKTAINVKDPRFSEDMYGVCVGAREVVRLAGSDGELHDISCPISYCIISRYPFFELHQAVILQILMLLHLKRVKHLGQLSQSPDPISRLPRGKPLGPHQVPACVTLLKKYYESFVPKQGQSIVLPAPKLLLPISFQRPSANKNETNMLIAQWCCPLAWAHLTAETLVDLLEVVLREFKIIVVDVNLCMLSCATYSFIPLLHPLQWCGVFLPILPHKIIEMLEAPVPLLAGVTELPSSFLPSTSHLPLSSSPSLNSGMEEETFIWYPSQNKFHFHRSFKRLLPNRNTLIANLKPHFSELRRLQPVSPPSRTLPHQLPYQPIGMEEQAHIKIMFHLIQQEIVTYINYVRKTNQFTSPKHSTNSNNSATATPVSSSSSPPTTATSIPKDPRFEPFIARFKETQMLDHYLQDHELDEDDY